MFKITTDQNVIVNIQTLCQDTQGHYEYELSPVIVDKGGNIRDGLSLYCTNDTIF